MLTTDQKSVVAELAIARKAAELGIGVWSAYTIERYDLIFDLRPQLDFEFDATLGPRGAIAQLGERLAGSQKVAGSSPAGSTD